MSRPYYREWTNMRHFKGKSFLAPPTVFRADRALYFPNMHGDTLSTDGLIKDTTPVLRGSISIVSIFNARWAENQVDTFTSAEAHPELQAVLREHSADVQMVRINHIENIMWTWLAKLFAPGIRRKLAPEDHKRHFFITKGFEEPLREAIGMLNSKVGYTYLLDRQCRIRWAASANALPEEKSSLVKGVRRLLDER